MRRVVIVAFDRFQLLDIAGPAEVFSMATRLGGGPYEVRYAAVGADAVTATNGATLAVDTRLDRWRPRPGSIDTLLVAGGMGAVDLDARHPVTRAVARLAPTARRVAAVCTGSFVLAAAGLLAGRRAATHWSAVSELQRRHPDVDVDPDPIWVRDGDVWTSAGVTAGIDLALALVEDDDGRALARRVARQLVVYLQRPADQGQFSALLAAQASTAEPTSALGPLVDWMGTHLDADLSVAALARRAHVSPRTLARAFAAELGTTPGAYVESLRLDAARQLLETTDRSVDGVARACGFGTVETMHRAFRRRLGTTPGQYRRLTA